MELGRSRELLGLVRREVHAHAIDSIGRLHPVAACQGKCSLRLIDRNMNGIPANTGHAIGVDVLQLAFQDAVRPRLQIESRVFTCAIALLRRPGITYRTWPDELELGGDHLQQVAVRWGRIAEEMNRDQLAVIPVCRPEW